MMVFMRMHNKKYGYTLAELIVYVAVFSFISVVVVNSLIIMGSSFLKVRMARNINTAAATLLERIVFDVRSASSINTGQSIFDASPGNLAINTLNSVGTPIIIEFYYDSGVMRVREDSIEQGALTADTVVIDSIIFRHITDTNVDGVKIELAVHDAREKNPESKKFYQSAIVRKK